MAVDFNDLSEQRFASDLQQAAAYKPLLKEDLNKAYKRYAAVGVKMGRVKGKSDAQLYKQATDDVLKWWKKNKTEAAASKAKADQAAKQARWDAHKAAQKAAQSATSPGTGSRSTGSGGTGSGGSGTSRGASLPDTAMGSGGSRSRLPHISQPLSRTYMNAVLEQNALDGANIPSYATKNRDAFDAWVKRAIAYRRARTGQTVATRAPAVPAGTTRTSTGTKVTTSKPIASNRAPVIR